MRIISKIRQMSYISRGIKRRGFTIGFVPTMGALHEGHLSLIRKAKKENRVTVVSIFVNPIQFSPREDFNRYPRDLSGDRRKCLKEGVDFIFYPKAQDMFPRPYKTFVKVQILSDVLCGKTRPGHFQGVATVVAKLFHIIEPDNAYFGQKDIQQTVIIKKMSDDLNMGINIRVLPTVRERDGLAMSSRNAYLNPRQRKEATVLYEGLMLAKKMVTGRETNPKKIINRAKEHIKSNSGAKIDYVSIVDLHSLVPVKKIDRRCVIALAAWMGKTRLVDNIIIGHKAIS